MKRCTRCHAIKPEEEFYPRLRHDDGSVKTRNAKCKPCERALSSERGKARRRMPPNRDRVRDFLPVEPFREWCAARIAEDGVGLRVFASRIGMPERRLNDHLNGRSKHIQLQVVDRALVRDGGWHLSQLYPDLYPDAPFGVIDLLREAARSEAVEEWESERAMPGGKVAA